MRTRRQRLEMVPWAVVVWLNCWARLLGFGILVFFSHGFGFLEPTLVLKLGGLWIFRIFILCNTNSLYFVPIKGGIFGMEWIDLSANWR
ncbi:unnamed protein product [Linum trigynum]|uniref:Transmembrane protein n=1 Tax=Linum trigynum TaxID=586398 RepID=A0AAV2GV43_9ROSI